MFVYGALINNVTFAQSPANGIDGRGWISKVESSISSFDLADVYFGMFSMIKDYAPAISINDSVTIDLEANYSDDIIKYLILSNVIVYDSYDYSNTNPANDLRDDGRFHSYLRGRINRNPINFDAKVDWNALGLDLSKPGVNNVKIFLTDSNRNATATNIVVNVVDSSVEKVGSVAVTASDFNIDINDLEGLTKSDVKELANLLAWNTSSGQDLTNVVSVNDEDFSALVNATSTGNYEIRFKLGITTKTVTATVTGEAASVKIVGKDFATNISEARSMTRSEFIQKADIKLYKPNGDVYSSYDNVSFDLTELNSVTGAGTIEVEVTFDDGDLNDSVTVTVTVVDGVEEIAISANDFTVDLKDVKQLTREDVIDKSGLEVYHNNYLDDLSDVVIDFSNVINATSSGKVEVFINYNGHSKSIFVTIIDNKKEIEITANDFRVNLDDVKGLTKEDVIISSGLKVYNKTDDVYIDLNDVIIDYSSVTNAIDSGNVQVVITYKSEGIEVSKTINVEVFKEIVIEYAIEASNFVLQSNELNDSDLRSAIIVRSGVKARNVTEDKAANITFETNQINSTPGQYELVFKTENNVSKTVKVFVVNDGVCYPVDCNKQGVQEVVVASDFIVESSEFDELDENKLIELSNAKAYSVVDGKVISVYVDYSGLTSEDKSYDVVFSTASGLETVSRASVGNNISTNGIKALSAKNVVMTSEELKNLNADRDLLNEELIDRSEAKAWTISTNGSLSTVNVDSSEVKLDGSSEIEEPIAITGASQPSEVIVANLIEADGGTIIGYEDLIDANDFALSAYEVATLNDEKLIELASARAWNLSDLSDVKITSIDYSAIQNKQGVYDVVFKTDRGTTSTIQVFVGELARPVIDKENNTVVFSNGYQIEDKQVESFSDEDHVSASKIKVIDQHTLEEKQVTNVNKSSLKNSAGVYIVSFETDANTYKIEVNVISNNVGSASLLSTSNIVLGAVLIIGFIATIFGKKFINRVK